MEMEIRVGLLGPYLGNQHIESLPLIISEVRTCLRYQD